MLLQLFPRTVKALLSIFSSVPSTLCSVWGSFCHKTLVVEVTANDWSVHATNMAVSVNAYDRLRGCRLVFYPKSQHVINFRGRPSSKTPAPSTGLFLNCFEGIYF